MTPFRATFQGDATSWGFGFWSTNLTSNCQSTKLRSDNYDFMTPSLKIQRCQHVSKWCGLLSNSLHHRIHVWYIHLDLSFNTEINQKRYLNITSPINAMGTPKKCFPVSFFSTQNTHREQTETLCRLTGWNCATVLWWRPVADPGLRGSLSLKKQQPAIRRVGGIGGRVGPPSEFPRYNLLHGTFSYIFEM